MLPLLLRTIGALARRAGLRSLLAIWMGGSGIAAGDALAPCTGIEATGSVGTATCTGSALAQPDGVVVTGAIGTVTATGDLHLGVRSLLAVWVGGGASQAGAAIASPGGTSVIGSIGQVIATGTGLVAPADGVGPPPAAYVSPVSVRVWVEGVAARTALGRVDISATRMAWADVDGVEGIAEVGSGSSQGSGTAPARGLRARAAVAYPRVQATSVSLVVGVESRGVVGEALGNAVETIGPGDAVDVAWSSLQREEDDELALIALGVFDA